MNMEKHMANTNETIDAIKIIKTSISDLQNENENLKQKLADAYKKIELLENHINYSPGGNGYIEAKKHFEKFTNTSIIDIKPFPNEFYQNKLLHEEYMDYLQLDHDD